MKKQFTSFYDNNYKLWYREDAILALSSLIWRTLATARVDFGHYSFRNTYREFLTV